MLLNNLSVSNLKKALLAVCDLPDNEKNQKLIDDSVFHIGVERPWESTLDLIALYAANLMNAGGGRGPQRDPLAKMTRCAIEGAGFFDDGRLTGKFDIRRFASVAAGYVDRYPLADRQTVDYASILREMTKPEYGPEIKKKVIFQLTKSIEQFCNYLLAEHAGSAENFSKQFTENVRGDDAKARTLDAARFRAQRGRPLQAFLKMGPAITPNFLKDSQIGRAQSIGNLAEVYLGTLGKPDMHVKAFMLAFTGRIRVDSKAKLNELMSLDDSALTRKFEENTPCAESGWENWPMSSAGEDKCLNDLNFLAFANRDAGIVVDRLLYIAGAKNDSSPIASDKHDIMGVRYEKFLRSLGLIAW